jgi:large subunit ribosomal protein L17
MIHRRRKPKLQRTAAHRDALLSNLALSLIEEGRIRTTLAKAKALRPFVEKLVTLARVDNQHTRRRAASILKTCQTRATMVRGKAKPNRQSLAVVRLFGTVAPSFSERPGGYTRIIKLGPRHSDSAPMAYIEWCNYILPAEAKEGDS